jgi:hypothetical protein
MILEYSCIRSLGTSEFSLMLSAAADGDVGLHFFHAEHFQVAHKAGLPVVHAQQQLAPDARVARLDKRRAPAARTARMSSTVNSSGTSIMSSRMRSPFLSAVE